MPSIPHRRPARRRSRCASAAVAMLLLEQRVMLASSFIDPPAPPQVFLGTTYVPGPGATPIGSAGGHRQAAIHAANRGDTIILEAGATFVAPPGGPGIPPGLLLRNELSGSGWITIRSSALPDLPAP